MLDGGLRDLISLSEMLLDIPWSQAVDMNPTHHQGAPGLLYQWD